MGTPDPRHTIRNEWPRVKIWIKFMPDQYATTHWTDQGPVIDLAVDLGPDEQRSVLAHELGHLIAGEPCVSYCSDNERRVVEWTARYLIADIAELGDLLATHDVRSAARSLGITGDIILDRLACMTPAETEIIASRLAVSKGGDGRIAAFPRRTEVPLHQCRRKARAPRA